MGLLLRRLRPSHEANHRHQPPLWRWYWAESSSEWILGFDVVLCCL
jgi:hypothetical protein